MKPRLLVVDLWGLGDLAVATPFLQLASHKYDVTLVAKPLAEDLRPRFWPDVSVVPFAAPWTVFRGKYRLYKWPWKTIGQLLRTTRQRNFDAAVSARRDPRDHLLMFLTGAKRRYGFSRLGSRAFLTDSIDSEASGDHRYSHWQLLAKALGLDLPPHSVLTRQSERQQIIIHTGASQPVKVWPLQRYAGLVRRLRQQGYKTQVLCDSDQLQFWQEHGEAIVAPSSLSELCDYLESAAIFVGNDSGPGHLAAVSGIPTFTIFGNQSPAVFAPIHPSSQWIEGAPCRYKPCWDSCRFSAPFCLLEIDEETVCKAVELFAAAQVPLQSSKV
jgi:ADP-heptose:LPS heptosyltransferase